ncbi:hypothetical protein NE237_008356 [Protea cynaroides]|uniref:Cation/H+ exchanger domain-containing protein n=1 Tax=Protea cynaroides TaxID=273540 RepID=A0A9Q0KVQ1_9MAGN|nr:hypothetical protein NE237_008356 [Protea cynaroides]
MELANYEYSKMLPLVNGSSALTYGLHRTYGKVMCIAEHKLACKGIFYGDNPFKFVNPVFLAQLTIGSFFTSACYFLLRPMFQPAIVGQLLGGIIAGSSVLGLNETYEELIFPPKSMKLLETMSLFGCMVFLFLVGVRMDMGILKRSGSREWSIGILTYILPLLLSIAVSFLLHNYAHEHTQVDNHTDIKSRDLLFVATFTSMTSFHVISCILHDLKLLNSELGRIAGSSSMISGMLGWISITMIFTIKQHVRGGLGVMTCFKVLISMVVIVILMIFIIRPLLTWMSRQTPEGKHIKESFTIVVFVLLLVCCFLSQLFGQPAFFVPIALGLVVPDGPPLGSTVVDKTDCFVSYVMLPLYFLVTGEHVYVSGLKAGTWFVVLTVILTATLGKFVGTILPCLYYQMPFKDSISLALLLCSLGVVDVQSYTRAEQLGFINNPSFSIMVMTVPVMTGIFSFIVKTIYDPSRRYMRYRRRTIEDTKRHSELRILVCINNQESVPAIINVLEASNPAKESPMGVYVLNLFELVGRATPLFVAHDRTRSKDNGLFCNYNTRPTYTQRIINAFRIFESNTKGIVFVQTYTCIGPYATMHDDICTLAADKCTAFLILPFHKFWSSEGELADSAGQRNMNKQVLAKSPCSVGILVDGGANGKPRSIFESWSSYRIAVIFYGGADDREALIYTYRMADHPNVKLSVIRLVEAKQGTASPVDYCDYSMEGKLDGELINEFKTTTMLGVGCNRVSYFEEAVTDSRDIINMIQSKDDCYDLILTGRRHDNSSQIFKGNTEQIKFPELGSLGDMLASIAFKNMVSVLIVQQHTLTEQLNGDGSIKMLGPSLNMDSSRCSNISSSSINL